jgi:hypothetical protein
MTLDTLTAIAVIGGAIALAVIGLSLRAMRKERDRQAQAAEPAAEEIAPSPPPEPEPPPPVPAQQPEEPPPAPAAAADDTVEVLRVLRAAPQGPLLVEMEGQRYRTVNEIKDQKHGLDLVDAIMDLQQFLGLDIVASLAAEGQAAPEPEAARPAAEPEPLQRPSLNPIRQMMILRDRELKKAREKREAGPQPASIVEEIEAILVKRLAGSPFEGRSIHMRPGLHGGAHIDVDGRGYASIEDVADQEVKQFLKSVIAEWEAAK